MVREAIESLYRNTCTVVTREAYRKQNGATAYREVTSYTNQPCKLSFSQNLSGQPPLDIGAMAAGLTQEIKLFIAPELTIEAGSRIDIVHFGKTMSYQHSGQSALYENHQEIRLELFDQWA